MHHTMTNLFNLIDITAKQGKILLLHVVPTIRHKFIAAVWNEAKESAEFIDLTASQTGLAHSQKFTSIDFETYGV